MASGRLEYIDMMPSHLTNEVRESAVKIMLLFWRHDQGSYRYSCATSPQQIARAALHCYRVANEFVVGQIPTESQLSLMLARRLSRQDPPAMWYRYAPLWLQVCAAFYYEYVTANPDGHLHPWSDPTRTITAKEILRRSLAILPLELRQPGHPHCIDEDKALGILTKVVKNARLSSFLSPEHLIQNFAQHPTRGPQVLAYDLTIQHVTDWILNLACLPGFPRLTSTVQRLLHVRPDLYASCMPPWVQSCFVFYEQHTGKQDLKTIVQHLVDQTMESVTADSRNKAFAALQAMLRECPAGSFFQDCTDCANGCMTESFSRL